MQYRKPHAPTVPRTGTYTCSAINRSPRKKTSSTQTDKSSSASRNLLEFSLTPKDGLNFNEETTRTYFMALEYVNSIHSYMNKNLREKYGECGDTKPEGNNFFKLPEVPNYSTVFLMLLEKIKGPKLTARSGNALKKRVDGPKTEQEPKKYAAKENVLDFVPEVRKIPEPEAQNKATTVEREIQTVISSMREDDSTSYPSKWLSDDLSSFSSKKSSNVRSTVSEESPELERQRNSGENVAPSAETNRVDTDKMEEDKEQDEKEERNSDQHPGCSSEAQTDGKPISSVLNKDRDKIVIMDIIKRRVEEEITTYLDKTSAMKTTDHRPRLMKSHFHVVNIPPQINLLEYAQKKLERQLASEGRPVSTTGYSDMSQKQLFHGPLSTRKSLNIRPGTPKKVTGMFRKLSQEKFGNLNVAMEGNARDQSDGDSVILDDEEFEKINGPTDEHCEKKQKKNGSAGREKSNPLKLTLRDMTRVDEKMLNAIGLFTERGDIRPDVIDILEEQKRAKAMDVRNKQFRARRQWDLQIHLNPRGDVHSSFTSVSTEKSFISLSSTDLRSDFEKFKNVCQQVEYDE